ncbi:hypothetical protein [uncultured Algibacter sp.]|uniref:hypothetical protein n=1 Tax=uncultured Algibacter sp. TaxID=298659 RepID=UPI003216838E
MKADELTDILKELTSFYENIKAEVIVSEVQINSEIDIDFLIKNSSTFSRSYRRDVLDVERLEHDDNALLLKLSRNGIYDSLPERLFHSDKDKNKQTSYTAKRKRYKEEEKDARSFFSPIENEFFFQRVKIEKSERDLLDNYYNVKDDFLIDFWKINKEIPRDYIIKLIKLLPYGYKIAGDLELTRLSLEKILNIDIKFSKKFESKVSLKKNEQNQLGVNFVSDSKNSPVYQPYLEVAIGPIKQDNTEEYIRKNGILKFIDVFCSYFIPIELDVVTKILVNKTVGFVLNKEQNPTIGISTII